MMSIPLPMQLMFIIVVGYRLKEEAQQLKCVPVIL
jgi:hypothetical protein